MKSKIKSGLLVFLLIVLSSFRLNSEILLDEVGTKTYEVISHDVFIRNSHTNEFDWTDLIMEEGLIIVDNAEHKIEFKSPTGLQIYRIEYQDESEDCVGDYMWYNVKNDDGSAQVQIYDSKIRVFTNFDEKIDDFRKMVRYNFAE